MSKMIKIRGIKVSENTIAEALENYIDFRLPKFGDIVRCKTGTRVVLYDENGELGVFARDSKRKFIWVGNPTDPILFPTDEEVDRIYFYKSTGQTIFDNIDLV